MPSGGLPAEVATFLAAHIDSVPEMEILLLLHEGRERSWTAAEIAARIYLETAQVLPLLRNLHQRRLIAVGNEEEGGFIHDPRTDADDLMNKVATAYRTQLIAVTRLIHAKASPSVLEFARAFELKKDR